MDINAIINEVVDAVSENGIIDVAALTSVIEDLRKVKSENKAVAKAIEQERKETEKAEKAEKARAYVATLAEGARIKWITRGEVHEGTYLKCSDKSVTIAQDEGTYAKRKNTYPSFDKIVVE